MMICDNDSSSSNNNNSDISIGNNSVNIDRNNSNDYDGIDTIVKDDKDDDTNNEISIFPKSSLL